MNSEDLNLKKLTVLRRAVIDELTVDDGRFADSNLEVRNSESLCWTA